MSPKRDHAHLEAVLQHISDCATIVKRHGTVNAALADIEGYNAILMCLLQIGENLQALRDEKLRSSLPVGDAAGLRNIIAHNYGAVDVAKIAETLINSLPKLQTEITSALQ